MEKASLTVSSYKVDYLTKGEGDPLIFLHGYCCEPNYYEDMLEKLAESYKVYAPRLYGLGDFVRQSLSIEDYVNLTMDFIKNIGEENPYLVGHSLGGGMTIRCAEEMDSIRGIVCINNIYPNDMDVHHFFGAYFKMLSREIRGKYVPAEKKQYVRRKALSYVPPFMLNRFKAPLNVISHCKEFGDFEFQEKTVETPSLFLLSDKDEFFGLEKLSHLPGKFTNYQQEIIKERGHMWLAYEPELVYDKIIKFFEKNREM